MDLRSEAEKRVSSRENALALLAELRSSARSSTRLPPTFAIPPTRGTLQRTGSSFREETARSMDLYDEQKENISHFPAASSSSFASSSSVVLLNAEGTNSCAETARLMDIDYKINGARARLDSMTAFIPPRWIPDEEASRCFATTCQQEFDWYNRRHHCRHCGRVFCHNCTSTQLLLPAEFLTRNPQRVCSACALILTPLQQQLTNDIGNHQRINFIALDSGNRSFRGLRRYLNLPFSLTMGSEIRKAAYSTHNLFSLKWIKDKSIPLTLLRSARGLAFLTVFKGGMVFGGSFGSGLVIAKLPSGRWSAPTAIGTIGARWGALIGGDLTVTTMSFLIAIVLYLIS